ncbi:hypothetical protein SAMN05660862_1006 [Sphingobacterium psychroaquaticum]|uniref:Outer membrane protein beta-barrel domain-containing protein n=2 Tax=Sphingobacterium psychroaquaticum TaxID=561061 RepID=A0A1X7IML0_9SPHI|nr:hypothetical protein SAMN05660862_1006 [Sphingobacterium psychroaquaticum]
MITRFYTTIALLLISGFSYCQTNDSTARKTAYRIIERFPTTRTVGLQYEIYDNSDFNVKNFSDAVDGKVSDMRRMRASANIPVIKKRNLIFTLSGYYSHTKGTVDIESPETYISKDFDLKYWAGTASSTYITRLFEKPLIFNGSIITDGDQHDIHRTRGLLTSAIILKRSRNENFSVGVIGLIDKSARLPAIPMVSYERHLSGTPWTIELFFPQRLMLERRISENSLLFLGSEIFADRNYMTLNTNGLNGVYQFNEASLRSGITYEHRFFKHVYLLFMGGISNPIEARLIEKSSKSSDYVLTTKRNGSLYFNLGLSYNLF